MKVLKTPRNRISKTKVTALIAALVPVAVQILAMSGVEIPEELVRDVLYALGMLVAFFLRDGFSRGD